MGPPLWTQVVQQPVTSAVITLCTSIWLYIHSRDARYAEVGHSYDRVVSHKELWRILTSQLSHVSWLHLVFNMTSLWNLGLVEAAGPGPRSGSLYYLQTSVLLLFCSGMVCLGIYHVLIHVVKQERYLHVTAVGYSCVVFGWMAILAASGVSSFSVFGQVDLPMSLAPFGSLILTSIIIPRASFIGHLSGILAGYCIALGAFDWMTPFWFLSFLAWATAGIIWSLWQSGHIRLPVLQRRVEFDVESGPTERL